MKNSLIPEEKVASLKCHKCRVFFLVVLLNNPSNVLLSVRVRKAVILIYQIHSSDMESKTESKPASLTSEELAAIEDEEALNKMVTQLNVA